MISIINADLNSKVIVCSMRILLLFSKWFPRSFLSTWFSDWVF